MRYVNRTGSGAIRCWAFTVDNARVVKNQTAQPGGWKAEPDCHPPTAFVTEKT
jgi:hypothetical protein